MQKTAFSISLFTSFFMTGIIWFIQIVQYPSFLQIDSANFSLFHQFHVNHITLIVAPIMILEIIFTLILAVYQVGSTERILAATAFILIFIIFLSTFFIQVPIHNQLSVGGKNNNLIHELINSNWIRTGLWTLKSFLLLYLFSRQKKHTVNI